MGLAFHLVLAAFGFYVCNGAACGIFDVSLSTWDGYEWNCTIPDSYVEDGYCDCPDCSDEYNYTCSTCASGCPTSCLDNSWYYCPYYWISNSNYTSSYNYNVSCSSLGNSSSSSNCSIPVEWIDDSYCDCPNCQDESNYTCNNCLSGCPQYCGDWRYCLVSMSDYYASCHLLNVNLTNITDIYDDDSIDSCVIPVSWIDDGYCDCDNCNDESNHDCESCSNGCPTQCGDWRYCDTGITNYVDCNSSNCSIPEYWIDDAYCDCPDCEDESSYQCDICGGCPEECGDYVYCPNDELTEPVFGNLYNYEININNSDDRDNINFGFDTHFITGLYAENMCNVVNIGSNYDTYSFQFICDSELRVGIFEHYANSSNCAPGSPEQKNVYNASIYWCNYNASWNSSSENKSSTIWQVSGKDWVGEESHEACQKNSDEYVKLASQFDVFLIGDVCINGWYFTLSPNGMAIDFYPNYDCTGNSSGNTYHFAQSGCVNGSNSSTYGFFSQVIHTNTLNTPSTTHVTTNSRSNDGNVTATIVIIVVVAVVVCGAILVCYFVNNKNKGNPNTDTQGSDVTETANLTSHKGRQNIVKEDE